MELKDYLIKNRDGVSELELMQDAISEIEKASLNKFILATLNLNKTLEDIFLNNNVERISITLKLKFFDEQGSWEVYPYVIQKSDDKEGYDEEFGKKEYEDGYDYYDEYDSLSSYKNMFPKCNNIKTKHSTPSAKVTTFKANNDEVKIQAITQSLNSACMNLNSHNKLWFGDIKTTDLVIYLSANEMPDIVSHILGDMPKSLLAKTNLEIDLPNNQEASSTKKLKI